MVLLRWIEIKFNQKTQEIYIKWQIRIIHFEQRLIKMDYSIALLNYSFIKKINHVLLLIFSKRLVI
ncbi:hypothetical protein COL93_09715 [Bacillus toyonensis]|uniref:Uncharacterized protein n=1 Tax=Bacillus toyonensis TaxID=155322 RepID=A0A2C4R1F7_9BACI|nr:hypothetical protein COL93_09715 [Bacillus toyonensis]PHD70522.1 hypothetical protein COF40_10955 [Bacillus toyonensis]